LADGLAPFFNTEQTFTVDATTKSPQNPLKTTPTHTKESQYNQQGGKKL
jgi:hypothetical protein